MKYNDMTVENVTKEDLPKLAKLLGDDSILMHEDICFEHSKYSMNENGEITAFIILRQHSLYDYFGGDIPLDRNFVEWSSHIRDGIKQCFSEESCHFEVIFYYLKDKEYSIHLYNLYEFTHTFDRVLRGTKGIGRATRDRGTDIVRWGVRIGWPAPQMRTIF